MKILDTKIFRLSVHGPTPQSASLLSPDALVQTRQRRSPVHEISFVLLCLRTCIAWQVSIQAKSCAASPGPLAKHWKPIFALKLPMSQVRIPLGSPLFLTVLLQVGKA